MLSFSKRSNLFVKRRYATICISQYIYIYIHIKVNIIQRQVHQMKSAHFSLPVFGTSMGKPIMEFFHVLQVCFIQQVSSKTNKICILKRMSGFLHVLLHPACVKKMSSQSEPSHCQETLRWGISFKISITETPILVDPAS